LLPKCDSSVMPGNTVFHFATEASLGLRIQATHGHPLFLVFECDAITAIRVLLDEHANGLGVRVLAGACGLLRFYCGNPKLYRRDADDSLEVKGKLALVREADAERDVHQAELAICPQEVLRSFNAARDHIQARRQPSSRLELPREVIGTEMNDGSHLLQRSNATSLIHR
jgi:hypothetical protein